MHKLCAYTGIFGVEELMKLSIKLKLLAIVIFASVSPLIVAVSYSTTYYSMSTKDQLFANLISTSKEVERNYFQHLDEKGRILLTALDMVKETSPIQWSSMITAIVSTDNDIIVAGISNDKGTVVALSNPEKWSSSWVGLGKDVSENTNIKALFAGERYLFSESSNERIYYTLPFTDQISNREKPLVMFLGTQFALNNGSNYALFIIIDWYDLAQTKILSTTETAFGLIGSNVFTPTSSGNMIWADTNAQRVNTFLNSTSFGEAWSFYHSISNSRPSSLESLNPGTKEYVLNGQGRMVAVSMAPSWFPYSLGFFAYLTNPEKVYAFLDAAKIQSVLVALVAVFIGLIVSYFMVRNMSNRISGVVHDAKRITSGDLRSNS